MGFVKGYGNNNERVVKPFNQNQPVQPHAPSSGGGFPIGYVGESEKVVKPFNPNIQVVEEIVIVKPAPVGGTTFLIQNVVNVNTTSLDGDSITSETFSFAPAVGTCFHITVNGVLVTPANGVSEASTSSFYVTDITGTIIRPIGTYQINDVFHWNGSVANYELDPTDDIKIMYEI